MKSVITTSRHTDDEVRSAIATLFEKYGYVADPHTAIGFLGIATEAHWLVASFWPRLIRRSFVKS